MCSADPRPARWAPWLLLGGLVAACGPQVPQGGVAKTPAAANSAARERVEATDLIPADLDLVARIDLAKVRRELGPDPSRELLAQTIGRHEPEGLVRQTLLSADAVWLALRLGDLGAGDHVLVVHSNEPPAPDALSWRKQSPEQGIAAQYEARKPAARRGTARIFRVGTHDMVFVSPVETMSVTRVLRRGPDTERGQPEARGLVSLDYRARRTSSELQEKYPSLAAILAGIARVHATVDVAGRKLQIEGRIRCKNAPAATKVLRFFDTIATALRESKRYATISETMALSREGSTVTLRWPLTREAALALIGEAGAAPNLPAAKDRQQP